MPALGPVDDSGPGAKTAPVAGRISDPGLRSIAALLIAQLTRQHEDLLACRRVHRRQHRAGIQPLHRDPLGSVGSAIGGGGIELDARMSWGIAPMPRRGGGI